jgi:mannose/fructose-specific phosphotransferase system component IIA
MIVAALSLPLIIEAFVSSDRDRLQNIAAAIIAFLRWVIAAELESQSFVDIGTDSVSKVK